MLSGGQYSPPGDKWTEQVAKPKAGKMKTSILTPGMQYPSPLPPEDRQGGEQLREKGLPAPRELSTPQALHEHGCTSEQPRYRPRPHHTGWSLAHCPAHTLFPSAHWSHWALEHRVHSGDTDPSLIFKYHHMGKGALTASEKASVTPATRADACGS